MVSRWASPSGRLASDMGRELVAEEVRSEERMRGQVERVGRRSGRMSVSAQASKGASGLLVQLGTAPEQDGALPRCLQKEAGGDRCAFRPARGSLSCSGGHLIRYPVPSSRARALSQGDGSTTEYVLQRSLKLRTEGRDSGELQGRYACACALAAQHLLAARTKRRTAAARSTGAQRESERGGDRWRAR